MIGTAMNLATLKFLEFVFKRSAIIPLIVWALLTGIAVATTSAQTTKSPLPPPTGYVNDYANVIDPQTKARLETILTNLKQRANIEIAVVTVPTTNGEDIFD